MKFAKQVVNGPFEVKVSSALVEFSKNLTGLSDEQGAVEQVVAACLQALIEPQELVNLLEKGAINVTN